MKIVLEQEILGTEQTERTSICIYDDDNCLIASHWVSKAHDPCIAMAITKSLLESCIKRYGWGEED